MLDPIGSIFLSCAEPPYRKFAEVFPPHPRPLTYSLMHAHLPDNRKSLTTYCKHLVEFV